MIRWNSITDFKRGFVSVFLPGNVCILLLLLIANVDAASTQNVQPSSTAGTADLLIANANIPSPQNDTGSLFDQLFSTANSSSRQYDIPYPLTNLVARLENQLGLNINHEPNRIGTTLFPLSRCVHQNAASPNFFASPRVVLAADSQNLTGSPGGRLFLKDQFFLGYQQQANALEVISYNPSKGVFDFQVVHNYQKDGSPTVENAQDHGCLACHQNNAAIFPYSPWDETDSNPALFREIAVARNFASADIPEQTRSRIASIDSSTNQANMFSLFQRFWKSACDTSSKKDTAHCRAGLLESVLQNRLATSYRSQSPSQFASTYMLPIVNTNIERNWPEGVSLPSSDLKSRNPLKLGPDAYFQSAESLKKIRPHSIRWHPENLHRVVNGLGGFFSVDRLRILDNVLESAAKKANAAINKVEGDCQISQLHKDTEATDTTSFSGEMSLECTWPKSTMTSELKLFADFYIANGYVKGQPTPNRMVLGSDSFLTDASHRGGNLINVNGRSSLLLELHDKHNRLRARFPNGHSIQNIEFLWSANPFSEQNRSRAFEIPATATLGLLQTASILTQGIQSLAEQASNDTLHPLLGDAFNGELILSGLIELLQE